MDVFALMDVPEFCPGVDVVYEIFYDLHMEYAVKGIFVVAGVLFQEFFNGREVRVGFYDVCGKFDIFVLDDVVVKLLGICVNLETIKVFVGFFESETEIVRQSCEHIVDVYGQDFQVFRVVVFEVGFYEVIVRVNLVEVEHKILLYLPDLQ